MTPRATSAAPSAHSTAPATHPAGSAAAPAGAPASAPTLPEAQSPTSLSRHVVLPSTLDPVSFLGARDEVLRALERGFPDLTIHVLGSTVTISSAVDQAGTVRDEAADRVTLATELVGELVDVAAAGTPLTAEAVERAIGLLSSAARPAAVMTEDVLTTHGRSIRPKSLGQKAYTDAIASSTITFGIGPAGTGKTYLAMARAVDALVRRQVSRIILTRPAVEAGENLGFLPGSLTDKIDPYLRPLYDALHDMLEPDALPRLMAAGTIEVAPLAYMRGRTLNDAFVILDEAQNTSPEQMKMFLTRLGFGSKMVVTGDVSQIDLPGSRPSGLVVVRQILEGIEGVSFCDLGSEDVVRHRLVGQIIDAYDAYERSCGARTSPAPASAGPRPSYHRRHRDHGRKDPS